MILRTILCVLALSSCAAAPSVSIAPPHGADLYSVETLGQHVHVLTQGDAFHIQPRGNVEIIEQARGFIIVDSGGSPAGADEVIAVLRRLAPSKPVIAVVLIHWHGEHSLGVSRFLEEWPQVRIIGAPATREALQDSRANAFMPGDDAEANARYLEGLSETVKVLRERGADATLPDAVRQGYAAAAPEYERFSRDMSVAHRVAPTEVMSTRLDLDDPETPVRVLFLGRANTAGDLIIWLPRQRIVMTGDVLVRPIPYGFNSYVSEWLDVLKRIDALNPRIIAPGHGEPQFNREYLRLIEQMLNSVHSQVAALAGDASVTPDNAATRVDLSRFEPAITMGDPWKAWYFERYWKRPIVSSALREARGEAITAF